MLHGWGDCGATFQFLVDELQDEWFIVAPDWRGFGRSGHSGSSYWFPDYLADLDRILNLYSPQAAVVLLGHSMGANVAALFSGILPERVSALINVEGFGLHETNPDDAPAHYRRWIERTRAVSAYTEYPAVDTLAQKILRRSPAMGIDRARYVASQWATKGDDGILRIRADPAHKWPGAIQYRRAEAIACWRRIEAPVLQVVGEKSDFADAADTWFADLGGPARGSASQRIRIPGAGHMVHFEQPGHLARVVEAFVSDL